MKAINIVLDESNPTKIIFVEIENDVGQSIRIGKRKQVHGLTHLRITTADIDLTVPHFRNLEFCNNCGSLLQKYCKNCFNSEGK